MSDNHENKLKSSTGLDGNVAALLSYAFGLITGIIFLIIERDSKYVKYHALQSILISAVFIILNMVLGFIPILGWILGILLTPVGFILWLFLMYQAYQGKWYKLPILGDIAEKQAESTFK